MKSIKLAVVTALFAAAGAAGAATQGDLSTGGAASTGSAEVTVIKDNSARISNIADFDFGTAASYADLEGGGTIVDSVCLFSTTSYTFTVASANSFELEGDTGSTDISYTVDVGGTALTAASTTISPPPTANTTQELCGDANGADAGQSPTTSTGTGFVDVTVAINQADFEAAVPATYTDTLTLTIDPT